MYLAVVEYCGRRPECLSDSYSAMTDAVETVGYLDCQFEDERSASEVAAAFNCLLSEVGQDRWVCVVDRDPRTHRVHWSDTCEDREEIYPQELFADLVQTIIRRNPTMSRRPACDLLMLAEPGSAEGCPLCHVGRLDDECQSLALAGLSRLMRESGKSLEACLPNRESEQVFV